MSLRCTDDAPDIPSKGLSDCFSSSHDSRSIIDMSRVIVDNQSSLLDVDAVILVKRVMLDGFKSIETIQGEENFPKYCHITTFISGSINGDKRYVVYARPRKTKFSAYSFLVYEETK